MLLCVSLYSSPGHIYKPTTNTSIKTRNSYLIDPYSVRTNIMNAVVWLICLIPRGSMEYFFGFNHVVKWCTLNIYYLKN